jgi:hypothetical protein
VPGALEPSSHDPLGKAKLPSDHSL